MKTIRIDGEVVDLSAVVNGIKTSAEDIELVINSPGGDVFEGLQVVKAIENSKHHVTARVEVMAASIAAIIALACEQVRISRNDLMMLHNSWTLASGNKDQLQGYIEAMTAVDTVLHNVIGEHCYDDGLLARVDAGDVWMVGEEVAENFDHAVLMESTTRNKLAACASLANLILNSRVKDEVKEEEEEEKTEEVTETEMDEEKEIKDETEEERQRRVKINVPEEEEPEEEEPEEEEETEPDPETPADKYSPHLMSLLEAAEKLR